MINDIEAEEYIFVSHAIYQELGYKPPIDHPKLNRFIGVSQYSCDKLEEYARKLGRNDIKAELCYNPLTLEPKEKVIHLVSATRLDDKTKGGERTLKLIEALDRYCQRTGKHYLWTIFTNLTGISIKSKNVILMQPRVDVRPFIAEADYIIQLSNDMETYCYTINEALGYGVPIVTTPLTVLNEFDLTDDIRITLDWDCSNIDEVARQIFEKPKKEFNYNLPKDSWEDFLIKDKSKYKEERTMKYKVKALKTYKEKDVVDKNLGIIPNEGYEFIVDKERLEILLGDNEYKEPFVEVVEETKLESIENEGEQSKEEVTEEVVQAVAKAIVEESKEENKEVEEVVNEIIEEAKDNIEIESIKNEESIYEKEKIEEEIVSEEVNNSEAISDKNEMIKEENEVKNIKENKNINKSAKKKE